MISDIYLTYVLSQFEKLLDASLSIIVVNNNNKAFCPGGWNGTRCSLETPVRNTANLSMAFAIGWKIYKNEKYRDAGIALTSWLVDRCIFYRNDRFILRQQYGQDSSNGVIGPGWLIQSLVECGKTFNIKEAIDIATRLYDHHVFNKNLCLWHRSDDLTNNHQIDFTIDHQLVFAEAALILGDISTVKEFLDGALAGGFCVRGSGRINHIYKSNSNLRNILNRIVYIIKGSRNPGFISELEDGYQIFILYSLAGIHSLYPEHPIFKSQQLISSLKYIDNKFIQSIEFNQYAYEYNPPGFEILSVYHRFGDSMGISEDDVLAIFKKQIQVLYDDGRRNLKFASPDPLTLIGRICELARSLQVIKNNAI